MVYRAKLKAPLGEMEVGTEYAVKVLHMHYFTKKYELATWPLAKTKKGALKQLREASEECKLINGAINDIMDLDEYDPSTAHDKRLVYCHYDGVGTEKTHKKK